MVRVIAPRVRFVRRLGKLPGLTLKRPFARVKTPGEHGKLSYQMSRKFSTSADYKERLLERKRLQLNYGITRKKLQHYYLNLKGKAGLPSTLLMQLLESRLDSIVFRLGFAPTIPSARQMVLHKHILVNNICVNLPGFICKVNDKISLKLNSKLISFCLNNINRLEAKRANIVNKLAHLKSVNINPHQIAPKNFLVSKSTLDGKILSKADIKYLRLVPRNIRF